MTPSGKVLSACETAHGGCEDTRSFATLWWDIYKSEMILKKKKSSAELIRKNKSLGFRVLLDVGRSLRTDELGEVIFGAHRLQVEASVCHSLVDVFSLDDKGRKKCARLLPPWCDVAPGEAKP